MLAALLVLLGYLSGSVPYGAMLAKWLKGVDVRRAGSGLRHRRRRKGLIVEDAGSMALSVTARERMTAT